MNPIYQGLVEEFKKDPPVYRGRKMPYVLFGFKSNELVHGLDSKARKQVPTLFCLNVGGSNGQPYIIDQYLNKGYEILEWCFPTSAELEKMDEVKRGDIAKVALGGQFTGNYNQFIALERHIKKMLGLDSARVASLESEKKVLEERLAALEKANSTATAKSEAARKN